jgi:hypothetical protein
MRSKLMSCCGSCGGEKPKNEQEQVEETKDKE